VGFRFLDEKELAGSFLLGDASFEIVQEHAYEEHVVQSEAVSARIKLL
jgi:hypothetical protein